MHIHVIYGKMSRYDQANGQPFSGCAGDYFLNRTLRLLPSLRAGATWDTRIIGTADMAQPFVPGARILMLGDAPLQLAGLDRNLNKHRGYCLYVPCPRTQHQHMAVATYHPIDCWDMVAEEDDDEDDDAAESKDVGGTKRRNFLAWALHDFLKLTKQPGPRWALDLLPNPTFNLYADASEAARWLLALPAGTVLTLDIECRIQDHVLDCIGLRANGQAYVVGCYRPDNTLAFKSRAELALFWRALMTTFLRADITVCGHNLGFDLSILCVLWGLPLPANLYDTMIAMHRAEPLLEKSLSHAISHSLYTGRNHKADICPNLSFENYNRLRQYNAEDLVRTEQLRAAQLRNAADRPDLLTAIRQGNELLFSTLMMSLTGIPTSSAHIAASRERLLLKAEQLRRIIEILTGVPDFNPGSPQQVAHFIYTRLGYPVLEETDSGAPATGSKILYTLQTKQNNPLFPLLVQYKETRKAATAMDFKPLKLPKI
jgi:hypothetical protein